MGVLVRTSTNPQFKTQLHVEPVEWTETWDDLSYLRELDKQREKE